jgi:hypothetical protein
MYVCEDCLEKWNNRTFPYLQCPVCREVYGVHYLFEHMIVIDEPEGPRYRIRLYHICIGILIMLLLLLMVENLKKTPFDMINNNEF